MKTETTLPLIETYDDIRAWVNDGDHPERKTYVVRAINAHDELVTVLQACAATLAFNKTATLAGKPLIEAIRHAIAKAESK